MSSDYIPVEKDWLGEFQRWVSRKCTQGVFGGGKKQKSHVSLGSGDDRCVLLDSAWLS